MQKPLTLQVGDRIQFAVKYDDDARARRSAPVAVLLTAVPLANDASIDPAPDQLIVPVAMGKFSDGSTAKASGIEMLAVETDDSFRLGKTEITQRQFAATLKRNPTAFTAIDPNLDRPADSISWYDAAEFCNALSRIEGLPPDICCMESCETRMAASPAHAPKSQPVTAIDSPAKRSGCERRAEKVAGFPRTPRQSSAARG